MTNSSNRPVRRYALFVAAALAAAAFAYVNRYERVTVDLGAFSVAAVPLPFLFFLAFLLGMAAMLLISLPQDRRTRELLRAAGLLPPRPDSGEKPAPADARLPHRPPLDAVPPGAPADAHAATWKYDPPAEP